MNATQYVDWKRRAVSNEVGRIERAARESSEFLADAPTGSSNLREAMLVQAIKAVNVQVEGIARYTPRGQSPVMTTGLDIANAAALLIADNPGLMVCGVRS